MNQPHDKLFKKVFSSKEHVIQFINNFLDKELRENLDLETLQLESPSFVDDKLQAFSSDIIYSVKWKKQPVYLSLLFEHKSYVSNPYPQLLRYLAEVYQWQFREQNPFSVVIPIIIYHGKNRWEHKPFYKYFDLPSPLLRKFIPNFEYQLSDLNQFSDQDIINLGLSFLTRMLLLFKNIGDKKFLKQYRKELFIFVEQEQNIEQETTNLKTLILYIYKAYRLNIRDMKDIVIDLPEKMDKRFKSTYDWLMHEGQLKGIEKGVELGILKKEILFAIKALIKNPNTSFEIIEDFTNLDKKSIENLKTIIETKNEKEIKTFLTNAFNRFKEMPKSSLEKVQEEILEHYHLILKDKK